MSSSILDGGERLGGGLFGETWRVGDRVIKVAGEDYRRALPWGIPREIEVFERGLEHPNIAPFQDHGRTPEGRPWIATTFVSGATVRDLLVSGPPMATNRACVVALGVARALQAAHAVGVLHCDVNVHNVIAVADPPGRHAVLVDWGIAALVDAGGDRATTARLKSGTPRYAAPEQRRPARHSPATDVWGLGVLLYCMVYRRPPFALDDLDRDAIAFPPGHPELEWLLRRALAPRPADRPSLERLIGALSQAVSSPVAD